MENQVQVFETPDYHKTIEELNEELEQKHFTPNVAIETKPVEQTLEQILEHFNSVRQRPLGKLGYLPDTAKQTSRAQRLQRIQQELAFMEQALADDPASDLRSTVHELAEKAAALQTHKPQQKLSQRGFELPPTPAPAGSRPPLAGPLTYQLQLNALKEQATLAELDQQVRSLEHVVGEWKLTKPVGDALGELMGRMRFCNSSALEKIENQSRHLSTDLDVLLTSKARVGVTPDVIAYVQALHTDTYAWLSKLHELPALLERLKASAALHRKHLELDKRILRLERGSDQLMSTLTQLIQVSQQLSVNIGQGSVRLNSNIQALLNR